MIDAHRLINSPSNLGWLEFGDRDELSMELRLKTITILGMGLETLYVDNQVR